MTRAMAGALLFTMAAAAPVLAGGPQERGGQVYVSGGLAVYHEDGLTGETSVTYETAPGGNTPGWFVSGGIFLTRWASVEAELSRTGTMSAREPSRYDMTFDDQRRDLFVLGAVRFHLPIEPGLDLEPVVGGGIVSTTDVSTIEYAAGSFRQRAGPPVTTTATVDPRWALALGADVRIGSGRVAVVPSFRMLFTGDYPSWPTYYPGGAPNRAFRGGVAVRVRF